MSATTLRTPSYRHHKPSGQAVVTLDGRDVYLGRYGTPQSRAEFDRLLAEWLSNGRRLPAPASAHGTDLSVNELALVYLGFADGYYTKRGKPTTEPESIRQTIKPLRRLYGDTLAREFGPLQLKAVRQAMIDAGLCRNEVNKRTGRIVRLFKWAVGEGIVPPSITASSRSPVSDAAAPMSGNRSRSSRSPMRSSMRSGLMSLPRFGRWSS